MGEEKIYTPIVCRIPLCYARSLEKFSSIVRGFFDHTNFIKLWQVMWVVEQLQNEQMSQLRGIAAECQAFEHIIAAMGYGYSLLNVSEKDFEARCDYCIHWQDSHCDIFRREITQWK